MLRFFKKVRKSFIESLPSGVSVKEGGSVRKYLFYTIGEIALVVIGILIALQINNWNETRKTKHIEKEILQEIHSDLEETLNNDLNEDLEAHLNMLWSTQVVIEAMVNKLPYNDSLEHHLLRCFSDTKTYYKSGGYQSLLSRGIEIISNDSLRIEITDLYQLGFTRLDESAEEYDNKKEMWPFASKHFRLTPEIDSSFPPILSLPDSIHRFKPQLISYKSLQEDNPFIMELRNSMDFRWRKIRRCRSTSARIQRILKMIEKELK